MAKFLFLLLPFLGSSNTQLRTGLIGAEGSAGVAGSPTIHVHSDLVAALAANIPGGGVPGQHYPILAAVPQTGFSCPDQEFPGYFADTADEAGCQVFHICQFDGRFDSFLCPNGTVFNQQYFVCDWWFNVDCDASREPLAQRGESSVITQSLKSLNSESEVFSTAYSVTRSPDVSKVYTSSLVQEGDNYHSSLDNFPLTNSGIVTNIIHPATHTVHEYAVNKLNKATEYPILNGSNQYEIFHSFPKSFPEIYLPSSDSRSNNRPTQYLEPLALKSPSLAAKEILKDNITNYDAVSKESDYLKGLDTPPSRQEAELGQYTPESDQLKHLTNLYQISRKVGQVDEFYREPDRFDREAEPYQSPDYSAQGIEPSQKHNQSDRVKNPLKVSGQSDGVIEEYQTLRRYGQVTQLYPKPDNFDQVIKSYQKPNPVDQVTESYQKLNHFDQVTESYQNLNHFDQVTEPSQQPNHFDQVTGPYQQPDHSDYSERAHRQELLVSYEPDASRPHQDSIPTLVVPQNFPGDIYIASTTDIIKRYLPQYDSKTILVGSYYPSSSPSGKGVSYPPPAVTVTNSPSYEAISLAVKGSSRHSSLTLTDYYPSSDLTPAVTDRYLLSHSDTDAYISSQDTIRNTYSSNKYIFFTLRNTYSSLHKRLPFTLRNTYSSLHKPLPFTIRNTYSSLQKTLPFTLRNTYSLYKILPFTARNVYVSKQDSRATLTRHITRASVDLQATALHHQ